MFKELYIELLSDCIEVVSSPPKMGTEMEFSDDGINWIKLPFESIVDNNSLPFDSITSCFRYCRRVKEYEPKKFYVIAECDNENQFNAIVIEDKQVVANVLQRSHLSFYKEQGFVQMNCEDYDAWLQRQNDGF